MTAEVLYLSGEMALNINWCPKYKQRLKYQIPFES